MTATRTRTTTTTIIMITTRPSRVTANCAIMVVSRNICMYTVMISETIQYVTFNASTPAAKLV